MRPLDTSAKAAEIQLQIYRRMSPAARLRVGLELTEMSRRLLADGIRLRHPEYSEEEVHWAFIRRWLGPEDFARAYPGRPQLPP